TDPSSSPQQQTRANALLDQVRHITSVSENLLLLARADAGRLELKPAVFNFCEVLDGACDDARTLAEPQEISVETSIPERLPVRADRFAVELIVQNLIDNAIKYNHAGGWVRMTVHVRDGHVELTIANKAEPISSDRVDHIFERFYRARGDARITGHGLGLSIARELALAQQGNLLLVRSDRDGTEFCLRLPRE
ncbi:MAG: integral rane sensor signal transduction histidine kinase, partial [Spartobacteria bacterium]|nr:integral rane sensor signal transduction histidine kinase [Spartobacteria bacterium]